MDRISRAYEMATFAGVLDSRGQYDVADRVDDLIRTAQIDLFDMETALKGFDPENPQLRGEPDQRGHRPWSLGDETMKGNETLPFESTTGRAGDPYAPIIENEPVDDGYVQDELMSRITNDFGVEGDSIEEIISKLIHAQYAYLASNRNEETMGDIGGEYDPAILDEAKQAVSRWVEENFRDIESKLQGR